MKKRRTWQYVLERGLPYILAILTVVLCKKLEFNAMGDARYDDMLSGLVTVDSIILGFLGAIMPVILSMKNESKFVQYVFEKDTQNLFAKYLRETIFLGLLNAAVSLVMYLRDQMAEDVVLWLYYTWIFITIAFLVATYRSMSHMITLVFAKDSEKKKESSALTEQEREEIRQKHT